MGFDFLFCIEFPYVSIVAVTVLDICPNKCSGQCLKVSCVILCVCLGIR